MMADKIQSIIIPVITKLKLNTCDPYIIKYPTPSFDTKNSPIMTPIRDILTFIFSVFTIFFTLLGKNSLKNI